MSTERPAPAKQPTPDVIYVAADQGPEASAPPPAPRPRGRRIVTPLLLFFLTCLSTFFVGSTRWVPDQNLLGFNDISGPEVLSGTLDVFHYDPAFFAALELRRLVYDNWRVGLTYAACVIGILLAHELGHFLVARYYGVPASLPYFIPMPISPIGTMGAVIAMDGRQANRKELFDIGLAGPLAGLVVALPILAIGISELRLDAPPSGVLALDLPMLVRWWLALTHADYRPGAVITLGQLNPYFVAGWVGFVLTGLNMMPVGQLDGGHVTYALFGRGAHWIARGFVVVVFGACLLLPDYYRRWIVMVGLVMLIGIHHPPTSDDNAPLGWFRRVLGYASLSIPILTFAPRLYY